MSTTAYSHRIRVLACANCGAPVDAAVEGGTFRCEYCGTVNRSDRRDESDDLSRAREGAATAISESERNARLRDQSRQGASLPAGLAAFVSGSALAPERIDEAKAEWLRARSALARAPSFPISDRFFHLTILIVPRVDERTRRALLESAVELLPDEGHRHILRCVLARLAARAGDLDAAQEWLAPCNPRPLDLPMDTAYRYAAATLATARSEYAQVLAILGMALDDVPLADRDELACTLLRINALENSPGHEAEAVAALRELRERRYPSVVAQGIDEQKPLSVCARSWLVIVRAEGRRAIAAIEEELAQAQTRWFDATKVMVIAALTIVFGLLFSVPGCMAIDAGAGRRAHEDFWCPRLCPGCRGPTRTVAWQRVDVEPIQNFQVTYCTDPHGQLDSVSHEELYAIAVGTQDPGVPNLRPYQISRATRAATMFGSACFATLPLTLACTLGVMAWGYRMRIRRRRVLAERLDDARRKHTSHTDGHHPRSCS